MGAGAGFNALAAAGAQAGLDKIQRKRDASDEERRTKAGELIDTGKNLRAQLSTYKDDKGNIIPEYQAQYDKANDALTQVEYGFNQLYHPDKAPGKMQEDWHYLLGKIKGITSPKDKTPSSVTTQTPAATLNTQSAPVSIPELPAFQQTTPRLPSQGGDVTTTVPGVAASTIPGVSSSATLPASTPVTVKKMSWEQGQVQKLKDTAQQKAQGEAGLLAAGAPLSPEQQAVSSANVANAAELAKIQGQIKNYKTLNPDASDEDVSSYASTLLPGNNQVGNWEVMDGTIDGQSYPLSYDKKKAVYKLPDGSISSTRPENWKADPKASGATAEQLKEYASDTDPNKGPFPQWLASKRAQGTASSKPQNRDDRYIAINQKKALGQPLTPDESAFLSAYDLWDQKTKIDPGVARAAAFGAMRYIPVVSPTDPENVVMMRAGDAAKAGVNTPASIGFKTDAAITRYMTSGQGGTNINYFNTATDHLRLLEQAGEALNNGNMQLFNKYGNQFATATGDPAPSNFETVKAAVAGELSKTFKGTGATDSEIADINQTINQAQSPQQIQGAISYYKRLMGSKVQALQSQYEAGKSGKPNFPGTTPSNTGSLSSGTPKSKGSRSLAAAMALPVNKGKSADEVQKHLETLGYTVTKP